VLELTIGAILFALFFAIIKIFKKAEQDSKKDIALEALSVIWTRHKNVTLSLEQLAGLWREQAGTVIQNIEDNTKFRHEELQNFYDSYIRGKSLFVNSGAYSVIQRILEMIDSEGDAPSVVNAKGEPEGYIDKDAYGVLSRVTIASHSVNVAKEMYEMFKSSPAILPKAMIAAFGHDLGKLPSCRKKLYSMGDHPLMSVTILESIEGYKKLPYKDEINKAIKDHHRNPKDILGEKLKEADQNARRYEMSLSIQENKEGLPVEPDEAVADDQEIKGKPKSTPERVEDSNKASEIFMSQSEEEKERYAPQEIDLEWFNADQFLSELKPYINKLTGNRWQAFSMSDGYVYFQISVIEEVVKKLGRKYKDQNVVLMDADREMKRNIIYTVVNLLKREKDAIARGLIKDGFIGGYFTVRMKNGSEYKAYYTPFNVEAFGQSVSDFEKLKVGRLRDIEEVYPRLEEDE